MEPDDLGLDGQSPPSQIPTGRHHDISHQAKHGGHGWLMIVCCLPMLLIAGVLVATGLASSSLLLAALLCAVVMALTMRGMHR